MKEKMEERVIEEEENGSRDGMSFLWGVLAGGALGALAGLLLAPKSGKELRADIKNRGSQAYSEAQSKAKDIREEAQRRAQELKKEANRLVSEACVRAKEILERASQVDDEKKSKDSAEVESAQEE